MADLTASKIIEAYMLLRERRSELKQAYDAEDKALKDKQERMENWLLGSMESIGTDQFKAAGIGTAFRQVVTKVSCSDWPSFWPKMAELGRYDFMEKRLSAKAITDYLAEPDVEPLPGVTTFNEFKVTIRKA